MNEPLTTSPNAIIVDAKYLDFITSDFKENFENILGRQLNDICIDELFTYLSMDWGMKPGDDNAIDIYITYDSSQKNLRVCQPNNLESLNNKAFQNKLGEFTFHIYSNEGLIGTSEFFLDSLNTLLNEKQIKKLAIVGFNEEYGSEIDDILKEADSKGKLITRFIMNTIENSKYATPIIAYPIMAALGIHGDELK